MHASKATLYIPRDEHFPYDTITVPRRARSKAAGQDIPIFLWHFSAVEPQHHNEGELMRTLDDVIPQVQAAHPKRPGAWCWRCAGTARSRRLIRIAKASIYRRCAGGCSTEQRRYRCLQLAPRCKSWLWTVPACQCRVWESLKLPAQLSVTKPIDEARGGSSCCRYDCVLPRRAN